MISGPSRLRETLRVDVSKDLIIHINQKQLLSSATGWLVWPVAVDLCKFFITNPEILKETNILELGSGTGLVGFVCSTSFTRDVVITDLGDGLPMLLENARLNENIFRRPESVHVRELCWGNKTHIQSLLTEFESFDRIIGSDIVYHQDEAVLTALVETIICASNANTEVLIAYEDREGMIDDEVFFFGPLRDRFGTLDLIDLENNRVVYHFKGFLG